MSGFHHFIFLCVLALGSCRDARGARELPCPYYLDIAPCECSVDSEFNMDLDCSKVVSEEELTRVFNANMPFTTFRELKFEDNKNLTRLWTGVFGNTTFEKVYLQYTIVEEVEFGVFSNSYSTLKQITIQSSQVKRFPFEELPLFTALKRFYFNNNKLDVLPEFQSESLTVLHLNGLFFNTTTVDMFQKLPNIQDISLGSDHFLEVYPGTFTNLPNLDSVGLFSNYLEEVPAGLIEFSGDQQGYVYLHRNRLKSFNPGTVKGLVNGTLSLGQNEITLMTEEAFRPHLENSTYVDLAGNPLECGCDIAWLVLDPEVASYLTTTTQCSNGEYVSHLDPAVYENMCFRHNE